MAKKNNKNLNQDLAKNIIEFKSFRNTKDLSICQITIGGVEAVRTHSLAGLEEEVLQEMVMKFWSVNECVGPN